MPVAYRKPPRALVLPTMRDEQPSDNDFTVLLARDQPRLTMSPPPPMPRSSAAPRAPSPPRADRLMPPAAPLYTDPEGSAPGTAVTVVPPAPRTARALRPRWQTLAMGAGVFLAFGCVSGIAVELALSDRPHGIAVAQADMITRPPPPVVAAAAPAPAAPAETSALANTAAAALAAPAPGAPLVHAALSVAAADPAAPHPHKHHKHHHAVVHAPAPPPPPAPRPVQPAPDSAPAVADPSLPDSDGVDSTPAAVAAPAGSGAPLDDMAAAVQTLNQAKAEEAL